MRRLMAGTALAGFIAVSIGCFGDLANQTDTDPPVLQITSPQANDTVGGLVVIQATALDAFGVASVRFYIDGGLIFTDFVPPFQTVWNANGLTGAHTIKVAARDEAANESSQSIVVIVGTIRN